MRYKQLINPCPVCGGTPRMGRTEAKEPDQKVKLFMIWCEGKNPEHYVCVEARGRKNTNEIWKKVAGNPRWNGIVPKHLESGLKKEQIWGELIIPIN